MVTYKQDYQLKLPIITAISENQIKTPTMPAMEYIREADKLQDRCQEDKAVLMAGGLDWDIVTDIPTRVGAYYNAECISEAIIQWNEISESITAHLDSLLPVFLSAYRANSYLLGRVENIAACRYIDQPKALLDLVGLGADHPGYMDDNFDANEWFTNALFLQGRYNYLKRKVGDKEHRKRIRTIRNQAFTHLKEAVDEVCARARQVWQENDAPLNGYRTPYFTLGFVHQEHSAAAD
jgi:hypothetical protein